MMKKPERDVRRSVARKDFVPQLRRIADAIESGKGIQIRVAGERLYVPVRAEFSIDHERNGDEEELEFQLRWSAKD